MRVAVTAKDTNLDAAVDPRFGRCAYFVVVETETMAAEGVANTGSADAGGAGTQAAQRVAEKDVTVVLTGNCGPNAFRTLQAAGIEVVTGVTGTVREAVAAYGEGRMKAAKAANVASHAGTSISERSDKMRIAIPVTDGKLSAHFGHCEVFALIDVDRERKMVVSTQMLVPPPHEPGLLPRWLAEQGAELIIAGGMGGRAQGLFEQQKITVIVGAPSDTPAAIVNAYLRGALQTGDNVCDH